MINKATLGKEVDGVIEYIYPKTSADMVEYTAEMTVEQKIKSIDTDITATNSRISSIVAQAGTDNTEIVDARTPVFTPADSSILDSNGACATLKDRLSADFSSLSNEFKTEISNVTSIVDSKYSELDNKLAQMLHIEGIEPLLSLNGVPSLQSINPSMFYVFNKIVKANTSVVLFRINFINAIDDLSLAIFYTTGKIDKIYKLGSYNAGENIIYPSIDVVNHDYYIGINAVIPYGGTGDNYEYFFCGVNNFNPSEKPNVAKFSFDLYIQSHSAIKSINDKIEGNSNRIDSINEKLGSSFTSADFEEDSSWVGAASSLLAIPSEINGYITSVKISSTMSGIKTISIFNWDGVTISETAFELVSSTDVNFYKGESQNCKIYIKKGQYVAITSVSDNVMVTTWLNNHPGTPFIYMQKIIDGTPEVCMNFNNASIAIQYTVETDSIVSQIKEYTNKLTEYDEMKLKDSIVFLGGDSRSSNDYSFYGDILRQKINGTVLVQGASGWMTKHIASNSYFSRFNNYMNHDFAIFIVGGNDIGAAGTVGTFNINSINGKLGEPVVEESDISIDFFTGSGNYPNYNDGVHQSDYFIVAVDHIIRKYKAMFYDWKALNNNHKPKLIMCTDLPQKRSGGAKTWNLKENWERKRNAIIECCEKNNVVCLDLYKLCNFDMNYEPEWSAPTDKVNNNGLYFMDGLHPNMYGIDIITSLEVNEMRKYKMIN